MYQIDCLELDSRERFAKAADLDLILILSILLFLHDQLLAMYFQLSIPHNSSYKQKNDFEAILANVQFLFSRPPAGLTNQPPVWDSDPGTPLHIFNFRYHTTVLINET